MNHFQVENLKIMTSSVKVIKTLTQSLADSAFQIGCKEKDSLPNINWMNDVPKPTICRYHFDSSQL